MADIDQVAEAIARRLVERKESVAVAESAAGGLISAALLGMAGASAYFKGGAVVYTAAAREGFIGVTVADLGSIRASTEPYAALLARATRERVGATWAVAETGAAGPTGNRYGDAAGHAAIAVAGPRDVTQTIETGQSGRRQNMEAFALAALLLLQRSLDGE